MRTHRIQAAFLVIAVLAACVASRSLAQGEPAARMAALVKRLDDDSFTRRQLAETELLRAGPLAQRYLEQALASGSPEVRQRAENLLRRLRMQAVWEPTLLKFPQRRVALWKVKEAIASAPPGTTWGNFISLDQESRIELPATELPLLQAGTLAADQMGADFGIMTGPFHANLLGRPGVQFVSRKTDLEVSRGYSGPLRLEVLKAEQDAQTHELKLDLQLIWEPKFELVSHSRQPARIRLEGAGLEGAAAEIEIPIEWHTVDRFALPVRVQVAIPLQQQVEAIRRLEIEWPLCAAASIGHGQFEHPHAGAAHVTAAGEIRIEQWDATEREVRVTIVAENIESWPEPADALLRAYQWHAHRSSTVPQLNHCQLTPSGARWQLTYHRPQDVQRLPFSYRTEFTRKDAAFELEDVAVDVSGK